MPAKGMRDLVRKRFTVESVNEVRTSKMCSSCHEPLERYINRCRKYSRSRLFCSSEKCISSSRHKRFVDRDYNATSNILTAGESLNKPLYLSRTTFKESACCLALPPQKQMRTGAAKSESKEDSEPSSIEGLVSASPPSSDPPQSLGVGCLGNGMTNVISRP